jgi:MFS family permease
VRREAAGDSVTATIRSVPAPVWALLVGTFVNKLGNFLQVFLVLFLTSRGLSADQAGLALGAYGLGAVVGIVAGGGVTDRLGCRATISASMVAAGALTAAMLSTTDPLLVAAIAFATGAAAQAYRPASSALLAALTPEDRHVMVFALYRLAFNLGMTVGPLVGALLVESASYAVLFWADAMTSIAFGVVAAVALPGGAVGTSADEAGDEPVAGGYARVLADRRYALFVTALFLNAVVYVQYLTALPLHVEASDLPAGVFGVLVAVNGLIVILCELPVTRVVQRWSARVSVPLGVGLVGAGLVLYAGPAAVPWLVVATVVWSAGEIVGTPTASAYPVRVAPPGLRGRYLAAAAAAQNVGYAVGPVLGAAAWARVGAGVWWLCGAVTVAAVAAALAGIERSAARARPDVAVPAPADEPEVPQEVQVA